MSEHITRSVAEAPMDAVIDGAIAAWLRAGKAGDAALSAERPRLLHRIDLNGVGPLLALKSDPDSLPADLAQALRQRLIVREIWEKEHLRVVSRALDALAAAGLRPLLMKGTALAYSHYPRPAARLRGDSDILIDAGGRAAALAALERAGFRQALTAGGATLTSETLFQMPDRIGQWHDIDLHWRLNSSPVVARLFSHEELIGRSTPLPTLHPAARGLGDVHALLFGAVHRRLHIDRPTHIHLNGVAHPVIDALSWLMDIHLLFESLGQDAQDELLSMAAQKDISDILRAALADARSQLGTMIPDTVVSALASATEGSVTRYIGADPVRGLVLNLRALRGTRDRITLLGELFFPPEDYMRARFTRGRGDWLPILYLRRIFPGFAKTLRRGRNAS